MAGLGFKDFQVGEVLTSSDVDGYLMQQSVMRFADSGARGSALGTAAGTGVALAEGMVTYLDDVNSVQMFNGTGWVGIGNFTASTAITATDASWSVPTLADPVVRVTVVGGGGGAPAAATNNGTDGSSSSFACSAGTVTADGGRKGSLLGTAGLDTPDNEMRTANGGMGASWQSVGSGQDGEGGEVVIGYLNLTGVSTANVTIGAGGNGGSGASPAGNVAGGDGGNGVVIFEYRAG